MHVMYQLKAVSHIEHPPDNRDQQQRGTNQQLAPRER
jgi:hypothetical protein